MIYKVVIDGTKALEALNKLGIKKSVLKENFLFVDAENPDGACHGAIDKLQDNIIKEKFTEEIVDFLEEELRHSIKITKLMKVRPYA